jgi:hypothetical protein
MAVLWGRFIKFQHLTPDRHGVVRDAAIKVLGAALGCIGGAVADWFLRPKPCRDDRMSDQG